MNRNMMKRALLMCGIGAMALLVVCSAPTDQDMRWRSSIDVPVTANKQFYLGAQIDSLFFNSKGIQVSESRVWDSLKNDSVTLYDTTTLLMNGHPKWDSIKKVWIPDTVAFSIPTKDTVTEIISEDSLEDKKYDDGFGPIPISGAPEMTAVLPLAGAYSAGVATAVPGVPITIKWVYQLKLRETTQTLTLGLTNNTSATFTSLQITLAGLGTSTVTNFAPGTSQNTSFSVGGKTIDSTITVSLAITPATSGTFNPTTDRITAAFTMNGLVADRLVVMDSLLESYRKTFTNKYSLTDTVNVRYIDIAEGFFLYSVTNHTDLELLLSVTHRHLWIRSFAQLRGIDSVGGLTGLTRADTLAGHNGTIATEARFRSKMTNTYDQHNISASRLFPEWDPDSLKSITKVDYEVKVGVYGRRVTLSSTDSLLFTISTTAFKFKELNGVTTETYRRGSEPSRVPIILPWDKSATDSLRGNFKLANVFARVKTRIDLPEGALLDTVKLHYVVSNYKNSAAACSSDAILLHVTRDSLYERPLDITNVVNDYPDSVNVKVSLIIPTKTKIVAVNDLTDPRDPDYNKYIGRMTMKGIVDYNLYAPLCWTVVDTTVLDLGGTPFSAPGLLDPFTRMTDKHASFNVDIVNNTNVYLRLFAVATAESALVNPLVDSTDRKSVYMTTNQVTDIIRNPAAYPRFINLMGTGLLIPPRDSTAAPTTSIINLGDNDLSQILRSKKCGWRWIVKFIPRSGAMANTPDALRNTDWIKLNSWIHIDGVNSVDSIM